jgi:hypothetical protein
MSLSEVIFNHLRIDRFKPLSLLNLHSIDLKRFMAPALEVPKLRFSCLNGKGTTYLPVFDRYDGQQIFSHRERRLGL